MARREDVRRSIGDTKTPQVRTQTNIRHSALGYDRSAGQDYEILSNIMRTAGGIVERKAGEYGEDMQKKGAATATKKESMDPVLSSNEKYRESFLETKGDVDSVKFHEQLLRHKAENPGMAPEEYKAYARTLRKSYLEQEDSDAYAIGFSKALRIEAAEVSRHTTERIQKTRQDNIENTKISFGQNLRGVVNGDDWYKDGRQLLSQLQTKLVETEGLTKTEANEKALDVVVELAIEREDPSLLELFKIQDGDGQKAWLSKGKLRKASEEIDRALNRLDAKKERKRAQKKRTLLKQYGELVDADKMDEANQLVLDNGDFFGAAWVDRADARRGLDEDMENEISMSMATGDLEEDGFNEERIEGLVRDGIISVKVGASALGVLYNTEQAGRNTLSKKQFMGEFATGIYHLTSKDSYPNDTLGGNTHKYLQDQAFTEYRYGLVNLSKQYPDTDSEEYQKAAHNLKKDIIGKYNEIYRDPMFGAPKLTKFRRKIEAGDYDNGIDADDVQHIGHIWGNPLMTPDQAAKLIAKEKAWIEQARAKKKDSEADVSEEEDVKPSDNEPEGNPYISDEYATMLDSLPKKERVAGEGFYKGVDYLRNMLTKGPMPVPDSPQQRTIGDTAVPGEEWPDMPSGQEKDSQDLYFDEYHNKFLDILKWKGLVTETDDWRGVLDWKGLAHKLKDWKGVSHELKDWKGFLFKYTSSRKIADALLPDNEDENKKYTLDELLDRQYDKGE